MYAAAAHAGTARTRAQAAVAEVTGARGPRGARGEQRRCRARCAARACAARAAAVPCAPRCRCRRLRGRVCGRTRWRMRMPRRACAIGRCGLCFLVCRRTGRMRGAALGRAKRALHWKVLSLPRVRSASVVGVAADACGGLFGVCSGTRRSRSERLCKEWDGPSQRTRLPNRMRPYVSHWHCMRTMPVGRAMTYKSGKESKSGKETHICASFAASSRCSLVGCVAPR